MSFGIGRSSAVDVHAVAAGEGVLHMAAVGLVNEVDLAFLDGLEEVAAFFLAHRQGAVDDEPVHPFRKVDGHFRRHHAPGVVTEHMRLVDAQVVEHGRHGLGPVRDRGHERRGVRFPETGRIDADGPDSTPRQGFVDILELARGLGRLGAQNQRRSLARVAEVDLAVGPVRIAAPGHIGHFHGPGPDRIAVAFRPRPGGRGAG